MLAFVTCAVSLAGGSKAEPELQWNVEEGPNCSSTTQTFDGHHVYSLTVSEAVDHGNSLVSQIRSGVAASRGSMALQVSECSSGKLRIISTPESPYVPNPELPNSGFLPEAFVEEMRAEKGFVDLRAFDKLTNEKNLTVLEAEIRDSCGCSLYYPNSVGALVETAQ